MHLKFTVTLFAIGAAVRAFDGVDNAHPVTPGLLIGFAEIFALLVVIDSVYFATIKTYALCTHCGVSQKM